MNENRVRLIIAGREFEGWKSVRVEAGIERVARSFDLVITSQWPGQEPPAIPVAQGDACELFIGDTKVVTGFIDAIPISYDATTFEMAVSGRSRTGDLVDCSAVNAPGQWRGLKVEAVARAMCGTYGVRVRTETDTGAAIADHQVQVGESVFESLDRLMRLRHVLACDDADGALVIAAPGSGGRAATAIELGVNVLGASAARDYTGVYSEYVCKGQRSGDDDEFGPSVSEATGSSLQSGLTRRRTLVIKQSGQADSGTCRDRAEYERAHRMGKAHETTYVVSGWRQADGSLWRPNQVVRVRDSRIGIDADRLIVEVAYLLDDRGLRSQMRLLPQDAFATKPAKQAKAKAKGGAGVSWSDVK